MRAALALRRCSARAIVRAARVMPPWACRGRSFTQVVSLVVPGEHEMLASVLLGRAGP
jgi:hypothetical protein